MELKVILENAEVPDIRFHDLRHTFVTHALSGGVDAKTLPEILEHTNPTFILDTYTHVTTQMHKDATVIAGNFLEQIMWGNTMTKRRRKKEMGAVRLRKEGRWEGHLIVGRDIFGKPQIKYVMAKTKEECEEKVKGLQAQYQQTPTHSANNITFGEWMDFWYQNICKPKLRTTTQLSYENEIYKHIIPELGDIPLKNLSQRDFQQFYTRLKANGQIIRREQLGPGVSNRMVRACHANCRMAILAAIDEKLIYRNPIAGCNLPPKERRRMEFLEVAELQLLMIQAKYEG